MKINSRTQVIEMTKKFAKAAARFGSEEYNQLQQARRDYPNFKVVTISRKAPTQKDSYKGLTYKFMEDYIQKHDDDNGTIMSEFNDLIALDKKNKVEGAEHLEAAGYLDVKKWFLAKFPEIKEYKEQHAEKVQKILAAA